MYFNQTHVATSRAHRDAAGLMRRSENDSRKLYRPLLRSRRRRAQFASFSVVFSQTTQNNGGATNRRSRCRAPATSADAQRSEVLSHLSTVRRNVLHVVHMIQFTDTLKRSSICIRMSLPPGEASSPCPSCLCAWAEDLFLCAQ